MEYDYIKCGDCIELIKELDNKSVDVCFTSPPYNDTGTNGDLHQKYLTVETRDDWFEWQCEIIDEMLRVSKKLVVYNVQGIKNNRKDLYKIIGKYSDRIHDIVIWYKVNGFPTSTPHKISNTYEMLILIKPDGVDGVDVQSNFYRNVIVGRTNSNKEFHDIHNAVMEKQFCDEVIREFTAPGDIVLDPFSGMGTTALSCAQQGRHYIGFEINQIYCDASIQRIKDETSKVGLW